MRLWPLLLASCSFWPAGVKDDTADTGSVPVFEDREDPTIVTDPYEDYGEYGYTEPGPLILDYLQVPGCDGGSVWTYYAETVAWTDGNNLVNVWEAGAPPGLQWNEEHDLPSVDFSPYGAWDALEQQLEAGVPFDEYARNDTTLFTCGLQDQGGSNVYAIRVYDLDGNYADCAIFSHGVAGGVDQVLTGQVDEIQPVTARSEINDVDCLEWSVR